MVVKITSDQKLVAGSDLCMQNWNSFDDRWTQPIA